MCPGTAGRRTGETPAAETKRGHDTHHCLAGAPAVCLSFSGTGRSLGSRTDGAAPYRPETGNRFATYVWSHIRQAVQREIICGGTIVRIPVHLHDRMHKLSVYREPGTAVSYDALSRRVAAEEKNGKTINETEIKEILCKVEPMVSLRSLNETMKLDGETERQEMVTDPEIPTPDEEVGDRLFLASCLEQLTPRERQVIAMRYGLENCERMTLMEIGGKLHITKERVRQLEQRAMEKMRAFSRS